MIHNLLLDILLLKIAIVKSLTPCILMVYLKNYFFMHNIKSVFISGPCKNYFMTNNTKTVSLMLLSSYGI